MTDQMSRTQVARLAKSTLKKHWPGIAFSVTSESHSGGSSVRVSWTDGPTEARVTQIIGYMEGANFDAMQDLKTYRGNEYGNDYIFTSRRLSTSIYRAAAQYAADHLADFPLLAVNDKGDIIDHGQRWANDWCCHIVNRIASHWDACTRKYETDQPWSHYL